MLGLAGASSEQMLEIMNASGSAVALTGVSLALQALETCAAPIFALLLVEEGLNAANWKQDIIWILGLAVVTEIPYNLAVSGTALVPGSLNPVLRWPCAGSCFYFISIFLERAGENGWSKRQLPLPQFSGRSCCPFPTVRRWWF